MNILPFNEAVAKKIEEADQDLILPPLLSINEICAYLGLGPTKVRELIRAKKIPHTRVGNRVRVFATDLRKYLEKNRG